MSHQDPAPRKSERPQIVRRAYRVSCSVSPSLARAALCPITEADIGEVTTRSPPRQRGPRVWTYASQIAGADNFSPILHPHGIAQLHGRRVLHGHDDTSRSVSHKARSARV